METQATGGPPLPDLTAGAQLGKLAIRPCYINPRTTLAEVEGLARAVRAIGDQLDERPRPTRARQSAASERR